MRSRSSGPVPQPIESARSKRGVPRDCSSSVNHLNGQPSVRPMIQVLMYSRTATFSIQLVCVGEEVSRSQNAVASLVVVIGGGSRFD